MKPEILPDHPAFFRLSDNDRISLMDSCELWDAPEGACLYYPGDSGEDLIFLLSGRLESIDEEGVTKCWLPGDLWGEDQLSDPMALKKALVATEASRWIRWPRLALRNLASSSPSLAKSLSPLYDNHGVLLSGLSARLPGHAARRQNGPIRPSFRPSLIGLFFTLTAGIALLLATSLSESLPRLLPLAAPAIFVGWLLIFLLRRSMTLYTVSSDSVTSKSFNWANFSIESRHVPLDRIQGVETERNGLIRRMLNTGTVIVKTSALDGELVLQEINRPEALGQRIRDMQKTGSERIKGRDRETMRRTLEKNGLGVSVPRLLSGPKPNGDRTKNTSDFRFRKSLAVLAGKLILPLLLGSLPILGVDVFTGLLPITRTLVYSFSILPLLWALYRFEDWRNDSYIVSGGYAVDLYRKPLGLKESRRQVELASVQNIRTEQSGILSFLFRYGDVILVTAGGAADAVFENVSRPWKVQESLFRYREEELGRRDSAAREQRKEDLTHFAEALDQLRGPS